jgi:hypothetical protein
MRRQFEQKLGDDQAEQEYGMTKDVRLVGKAETEKELLIIIAKRGSGVDFAEKQGSPWLLKVTTPEGRVPGGPGRIFGAYVLTSISFLTRTITRKVAAIEHLKPLTNMQRG